MSGLGEEDEYSYLEVIREKENEVDNLRVELGEIRAESAGLQEYITMLEGKLREARDESKRWKEKVEKLRMELGNSLKEASEAIRKYDDLKIEHERDVSMYKEKVRKVEKEKETLERRRRSEAKTAQGEAARARVVSAEHTSKIAFAEKEVQDLKKISQQLEAQVRESEKRAKRSEEQMRRAHKEDEEGRQESEKARHRLTNQNAELKQRLASQEAELTMAKEQLKRVQLGGSTSHREGTRDTEPLGIKRAALQEKQDDIDRLSGMVVVERARAHDLEDRLLQKAAEVNDAQAQAQRAEFDLAQAREAAADAERMRGETGGNIGEIPTSRRRLRELENLLAARTEELRVAQAFMTTSDQLSPVDVTRMAEDLNEYIGALAFHVSDKLLGEEARNWAKRHPESEDARRRRRSDCRVWEKKWGERVVNTMRRGVAERDPDTTLLECMIQSTVVERCVELVHGFTSERKEVADFLASLWARILQTNRLAIAKNWLSITHAHLESESVEAQYLERKVSEIMNIGGWREDAPTARKVAASVQEKIQNIVEMALKIRFAIIHDIRSADICLDLIRAESTYDHSCMKDEDEYGSGKTKPAAGKVGRRVLCTVGMGVTYRVQDREATVILKPRVFLQ
ncbi:hypothetical protein DFP72DRAFT_1074040 [Ephemerocybe angulata]|uniref:Uncharacterized protein n=1 Tax=Ephemerocybe angulata TaxID=980116 RepID=A0A8H6HKH0_9AGAR|nr:hypothetical protein DFP72DRAFT_1074040 [Tulosesus angulatus]